VESSHGGDTGITRSKPGPSSAIRTRSRTVAEKANKNPEDRPRIPPPPSEVVPIRDVPVPLKEWTLVETRRGGQHRPTTRNTYAEAVTKAPPPTKRGPADTTNRPVNGRRDGGNKRRPITPVMKKPPKTAVVQISCPPGQYAETMKLAREKVNLRGLGIEGVRPRKSKTGALLLEIPGGDGATRAEALVKELREALKDREGVSVTRSIKTAEIRVNDIEDSVSAAEIAEALADQGQCQVDEVRVGPIRTGSNRLGTAWIRCPLTAASRIMRGGRLTVGWTRVRLELLPERPTTCYRCMRKGHVRAECPEGEVNEGLCYRCGEPGGHLAGNCTAPPRCILCRDTGRPDNHRVGSRACRAPKSTGGRRNNIERKDSGDKRLPPHRDPPSQEREEPMEIAEEQPEPPLPSPPRTLEWPASGEGWGANRPLPSRHEVPITGRGPATTLTPLQPSRPDGSVIEEERRLNRRWVITPVITYGEETARDSLQPPLPRPMPIPLSLLPAGQQRYGTINAMIDEIALELQDQCDEEEEISGGPSMSTGMEAGPTSETSIPQNETETQQSGAPPESGPPTERTDGE